VSCDGPLAVENRTVNALAQRVGGSLAETGETRAVDPCLVTRRAVGRRGLRAATGIADRKDAWHPVRAVVRGDAVRRPRLPVSAGSGGEPALFADRESAVGINGNRRAARPVDAGARAAAPGPERVVVEVAGAVGPAVGGCALGVLGRRARAVLRARHWVEGQDAGGRCVFTGITRGRRRRRGGGGAGVEEQLTRRASVNDRSIFICTGYRRERCEQSGRP